MSSSQVAQSSTGSSQSPQDQDAADSGSLAPDAGATGSSGAASSAPQSSESEASAGGGDAAAVGPEAVLGGADPAASGSIADQLMAVLVVLEESGKDFLVEGTLEIDWPRIGAAVGALLLFLLVRRLITRVILTRLRVFAEQQGWHWKRQAIEAAAGPISLVPIAMGLFFFTQILHPRGLLLTTLDRVVQSLVAISICWLIYNGLLYARPVMKAVEKLFNPSFVGWLIKALQVAVAAIGLATVLQIWGIQVAPIIAGFGLMGVAVALGAQDLFKNLIAGLLVLGEDRFDVGDWIRVDGVVEGTVEHIGFRSTLIRRFDKAPVHVPNAKLSDSALTNFSDMTHRRIYWVIGVTYSTSVEQLREIRDRIENYVVKNSAFETPEKASLFVRIDSFSDSSIDIMLYCFTKTTNWGEWLKIKEELAYHIMEVVEEAGSSFAFPSTSVYLESLPGAAANGADLPEAFVPPGTNKAED
ncbi:mechanosensitive ion channel family protein [Rhodovibrionaceae bacterium A322]